MGMYSFVTDSGITWRSKQSQKAFKEWTTAPKPPEYIGKEIFEEYDFWRKRLREWNEGEVDALLFDNIKLIGYWYEGFCAMLRDIGQWIEGTIDWRYETGDEFVRITFKNGSVLMSEGRIVYNEAEVMERLVKLPELPKRELLLRGV